MQVSNLPFLDLSEKQPFAIGDNRLCFRHPDDSGLCIKINRAGRAGRLRGQAPLYERLRREKHFDDNWQEFYAFQQPAIRTGGPELWRHLPRCYGWVETNLGPALISDFFADPSGDAAPTLEQYLKHHGRTPEIDEALDEFCAFLRGSLVLTKNLLPHNLVVADLDRELRLILIDGIGLATLLPLAKHSTLLSRRHVDKRIRWFEHRLAWETGSRPESWQTAEAKFHRYARPRWRRAPSGRARGREEC